MSKLSQLSGKSKMYKVGEVELDLKPRGIKDLDLLFALQDPAQQASATKKLISATLRQAVPDATQEEIDDITVEYLEEITNAVLDVNGFGDGLRAKDKPKDQE